MTDSVAQPRDLPAYLRRYPNPWGLDHRREKGLKDLRATVARCRYGYAGFSFDGLLDAVRRLDEQRRDAATVLVGEFIDRLATLASDDIERLVDALYDVHQRKVPGWCRLEIDHALQRMLFLLTVPGAHDLAFACVCSERTLRRWAAYKFYSENGLDDQARRLLALRATEGYLEEPANAPHTYYPGALIAKDRTLVKELGLAAVLAVAPTTQLRKEAIEAAMPTLSPATVAAICEDYPQELVWAVRVQGRSDYLRIIMDMVDDYRDDPYLLHRVVDCIARIGGPAELEYALHVASMVLDSASPEQ
ncbi:hypothetical protein [Micromonospora zamorensis]|uniref:hypothetical protein n=1 Tax=Micromonospora zamorensis TaxID=709883 RepID=UPI002E18C96A